MADRVRLTGAARPAARVAAVVRLEVGEVLRSRWLVFCSAMYAVLAALFFVIGLRESGVLAFTGMARVLASLAHALVLLLPLLALAGTSLVVNRARESGALELIFSLPITRNDYVVAVTIVRFGALLLPLLCLIPALALAGRLALGQAVPWSFLLQALAVSTALLWSFVGIGLAISIGVREPARAIVYLLLAWALGAALLDFSLVGLMLQWPLRPDAVFVLAVLNPVEAARLALLSGADRSLQTLGPVGVFLVDRIGPRGLFIVGTVWPAAVGTFAWLMARRRLLQGDVV